jgi:hypothetical protein
MPSKPSRAARSRPADRNPSLTDRVRARVLDARQAVDRKTKANFRAEPSLTSLVSVAVFLDELDILKW